MHPAFPACRTPLQSIQSAQCIHSWTIFARRERFQGGVRLLRRSSPSWNGCPRCSGPPIRNPDSLRWPAPDSKPPVSRLQIWPASPSSSSSHPRHAERTHTTSHCAWPYCWPIRRRRTDRTSPRRPRTARRVPAAWPAGCPSACCRRCFPGQRRPIELIGRHRGLRGRFVLGVAGVAVLVPGQPVAQQRLAEPEVIDPRQPIGLREERIEPHGAQHAPRACCRRIASVPDRSTGP